MCITYVFWYLAIAQIWFSQRNTYLQIGYRRGKGSGQDWMATTGHLWHKAGGVNIIGVTKTKPTTLVTTLAPRPTRSGWACWPSGFLSTLAAANGSGLRPWAPVARFIRGHWPLVVAHPPMATTPMAAPPVQGLFGLTRILRPSYSLTFVKCGFLLPSLRIYMGAP